MKEKLDLQDLKRKISSIENTVAQGVGAVNQLYKQLKDEFSIADLNTARRKIEKLKAKAEKFQRRIDKILPRVEKLLREEDDVIAE